MKAPERLFGSAKAKWDEVFAHFRPSSQLDVEAAIQYCEAWADYMQARTIAEEQGPIVLAANGTPYPNPAINIGNRALDQMRRHYKILAPLLDNNGGKKSQKLEF